MEIVASKSLLEPGSDGSVITMNYSEVGKDTKACGDPSRAKILPVGLANLEFDGLYLAKSSGKHAQDSVCPMWGQSASLVLKTRFGVIGVDSLLWPEPDSIRSSERLASGRLKRHFECVRQNAERACSACQELVQEQHQPEA